MKEYHKMSPAQLQFELNSLAHEQAVLGIAWAEAASTANKLDDRKHDCLAKITENIEGKSNAERERKARITQEWDDFIEGLHSAKASALMAKIKYETCVRDWETVRSMMSQKNTEMRFNI